MELSDALSCRQKNTNASNQNCILSGVKRKSPEKISSDYRANYDMHALECQPAAVCLDPLTQPFTPPDTGYQ